jgi:hypothetical protein
MPRTSKRWTRVVVALAMAAGLIVTTGSPAHAAPSVSVSPATGLTDFQFVHLTGSGFEPGALMEWFQCRGGARGEADCDGYNSDFITADGAGNVSETVPVDARIWLPDGTEVDCRTDPAGCELGVGYLLDADEWPEAALEFDQAAPLRAPVAATAQPDTDLVAGETVTVDVEHVTNRFETWVFLCAAGDGMWGRRCDLDAAARVVGDPTTEAVDAPLVVNPRFTTPFGDQIDCTTAPSGCHIVVSWGFSPQPDRATTVAVSFAPVAPTTSTTTTIPPTTTTTVPSAPPGATPRPGRPTFTG